VKKHDTARQATDDNVVNARCILNTEVYKHTLRICTTVIGFPLQQWLYKRALMLINTCIVCHVVPKLNSSTLSGFITCLYVLILSCILY